MNKEIFFSGNAPLRNDMVKLLEVKPKIQERKTIEERIIEKIVNFVETYITGMPEKEA